MIEGKANIYPATVCGPIIVMIDTNRLSHSLTTALKDRPHGIPVQPNRSLPLRPPPPHPTRTIVAKSPLNSRFNQVGSDLEKKTTSNNVRNPSNNNLLSIDNNRDKKGGDKDKDETNRPRVVEMNFYDSKDKDILDDRTSWDNPGVIRRTSMEIFKRHASSYVSEKSGKGRSNETRPKSSDFPSTTNTGGKKFISPPSKRTLQCIDGDCETFRKKKAPKVKKLEKKESVEIKWNKSKNQRTYSKLFSQMYKYRKSKSAQSQDFGEKTNSSTLNPGEKGDWVDTYKSKLPNDSKIPKCPVAIPIAVADAMNQQDLLFSKINVQTARDVNAKDFISANVGNERRQKNDVTTFVSDEEDVVTVIGKPNITHRAKTNPTIRQNDAATSADSRSRSASGINQNISNQSKVNSQVSRPDTRATINETETALPSMPILENTQNDACDTLIQPERIANLENLDSTSITTSAAIIDVRVLNDVSSDEPHNSTPTTPNQMVESPSPSDGSVPCLNGGTWVKIKIPGRSPEFFRLPTPQVPSDDDTSNKANNNPVETTKPVSLFTETQSIADEPKNNEELNHMKIRISRLKDTSKANSTEYQVSFTKKADTVMQQTSSTEIAFPLVLPTDHQQQSEDLNEKDQPQSQIQCQKQCDVPCDLEVRSADTSDLPEAQKTVNHLKGDSKPGSKARSRIDENKVKSRKIQLRKRLQKFAKDEATVLRKITRTSDPVRLTFLNQRLNVTRKKIENTQKHLDRLNSIENAIPKSLKIQVGRDLVQETPTPDLVDLAVQSPLHPTNETDKASTQRNSEDLLQLLITTLEKEFTPQGHSRLDVQHEPTVQNTTDDTTSITIPVTENPCRNDKDALDFSSTQFSRPNTVIQTAASEMDPKLAVSNSEYSNKKSPHESRTANLDYIADNTSQLENPMKEKLTTTTRELENTQNHLNRLENIEDPTPKPLRIKVRRDLVQKTPTPDPVDLALQSPLHPTNESDKASTERSSEDLLQLVITTLEKEFTPQGQSGLDVQHEPTVQNTSDNTSNFTIPVTEDPRLNDEYVLDYSSNQFIRPNTVVQTAASDMDPKLAVSNSEYSNRKSPYKSCIATLEYFAHNTPQSENSMNASTDLAKNLPFGASDVTTVPKKVNKQQINPNCNCKHCLRGDKAVTRQNAANLDKISTSSAVPAMISRDNTNIHHQTNYPIHRADYKTTGNVRSQFSKDNGGANINLSSPLQGHSALPLPPTYNRNLTAQGYLPSPELSPNHQIPQWPSLLSGVQSLDQFTPDQASTANTSIPAAHLQNSQTQEPVNFSASANLPSHAQNTETMQTNLPRHVNTRIMTEQFPTLASWATQMDRAPVIVKPVNNPSSRAPIGPRPTIGHTAKYQKPGAEKYKMDATANNPRHHPIVGNVSQNWLPNNFPSEQQRQLDGFTNQRSSLQQQQGNLQQRPYQTMKPRVPPNSPSYHNPADRSPVYPGAEIYSMYTMHMYQQPAGRSQYNHSYDPSRMQISNQQNLRHYYPTPTFAWSSVPEGYQNQVNHASSASTAAMLSQQQPQQRLKPPPSYPYSRIAMTNYHHDYKSPSFNLHNTMPNAVDNPWPYPTLYQNPPPLPLHQPKDAMIPHLPQDSGNVTVSAPVYNVPPAVSGTTMQSQIPTKPLDPAASGAISHLGKVYKALKRSSTLKCSRCGTAGPKFNCNGCETAFYCNESCQAQHWAIHFMECATKMPKLKKVV
ncbi:uncharacterized protein LOC105683454 isoform X1 [Athalia rosae]|uniref:uncharacterized protein LOC105683454 isoform X1 n=1 Tax=Athalia rosae TaxID=37344 RepID=UPI002033D2CB|nr:uncharacterized protein LOC105683454 isoform X1 [Athalia rosae]